MNLRHATEQDIPKIVELLKLSLGEGLVAKTETYWRWKHLENPFGHSPVLVAEVDGVLAGVRAFMRWEWTNGKQIVKAMRAVDTATHPNFQGTGIFKKLTLSLLNEFPSTDVEFIYNTPNTQSRPGYLKMNWVDAGRLPFQFVLVNPLRRIYNLFSGGSRPKITFSTWCKSKEAEIVWKSLEVGNTDDLSLRCHKTKEYLIWRYSKVPVALYYVLAKIIEGDYQILIYRFKKSKLGQELRVVDILSNRPSLFQELLNEIQQIASAEGALFITFSGVSGITIGLRLNKGPIVTIRDHGYKEFAQLSGFKNWSPSLGDLELF